MIYGRPRKQVDESGLLEMQEVAFSISSDQAKDLSAFFQDVAEILEEPRHANWHKHIDSKLGQLIGSDVVVMQSKPLRTEPE